MYLPRRVGGLVLARLFSQRAVTDLHPLLQISSETGPVTIPVGGEWLTGRHHPSQTVNCTGQARGRVCCASAQRGGGQRADTAAVAASQRLKTAPVALPGLSCRGFHVQGSSRKESVMMHWAPELNYPAVRSQQGCFPPNCEHSLPQQLLCALRLQRTAGSPSTPTYKHGSSDDTRAALQREVRKASILRVSRRSQGRKGTA